MAYNNLSSLDECALFGSDIELISAENDSICLSIDNVERTIIDLASSFGATNFGHNNTHITDYIRKNNSVDITNTFRTRFARELAEKICANIGKPKNKVSFQIGGSDAVSFSLALCQEVRKGKVLCLSNAFHGLGCDTQKMSKSFGKKFMKGLSCSNFSSIDHNTDIELLIQNAHLYSCFVYEPIQGASCYNEYRLEWLSQVIKSLRSKGILIIADEIQCGYFRHGTYSVAHANKLYFDICIFSKSLTNGQYPLAAVVYPFDLENNENFINKGLSATFQTGNLGYVAGCAVFSFLESLDIHKLCGVVERELSTFTGRISTCTVVKDINFKSCSLGIIMQEGVKSLDVCKRLLRRGVLAQPAGSKGNGIKIAPPLTIGVQNLRESLAIVHKELNNHQGY